ncbi:MFS transporter [Trinickia violacea]|nr:MFS transporter [Trinickia violacea]
MLKHLRSGEPMTRIVWGLMLSLIAEQTVLFAVPLLIYERSRSVSWSGAAFALEWLPALVAYPFAGLMADRFGGPRLYRYANTARVVCLLIAAAACAIWPHFIVPLLMANGVLLSVLIAPNRMAIQKTIATAGPDDQLAHRQSQLQNVELLSMAAGPGIAAGVARIVGKLPLFLVAAGAFALAVICWRGLKQRGAPSVPQRTSALADLGLGWRILFETRAVILLACVVFSINFVFAVALSANAYMITGVFSAPDFVVGLMSGGAGALGLINMMLVPRLLKAWTVYHLGAGGFALFGAGLIAMGLAPNVWSYAVAYLAGMAGVTLFNVFNRTERVQAIGKEHLGKVSGVFYLVNGFSYPLGGIVTASLGARFGVQPVLLSISSLVVLVCIPTLWATIRQSINRTATISAEPCQVD